MRTTNIHDILLLLALIFINPSLGAGENEVLQQKTVEQKGRTITYQLVEPPPLVARPPEQPAIQPIPLATEEVAADQEAMRKPVVSILVDGLVYKDGITEFQWQDSVGTHRAFSNVDFTKFPPVLFLEDQTTSYQLMLLISHKSSQLPSKLPHLAPISIGTGEYILDDDGPSVNASASSIAAFDALHKYFDARREELLSAEALVTPIPEPAQDEIITFWRKDSPTP